jgi:hypothetical protein
MADDTTIDREILGCFLGKIDGDPSIPPEVRAALRALVEQGALETADAVAAAVRGKEAGDAQAADAD